MGYFRTLALVILLIIKEKCKIPYQRQQYLKVAISIKPGIPKVEIAKVMIILPHMVIMSVLLGINSKKSSFLTLSIMSIPPKISISKTNVCSPVWHVSLK